jgi:predicted  nucleic acid-binding Zn-ribbon protein
MILHYQWGAFMEGKIVVYSSESGLGKIITPEKKKFNFSVDDWDEYETMPEIGQTIQFEPDGIKARHITIHSAETPQTSPQPDTEQKPAPAPEPPAPQPETPDSPHIPSTEPAMEESVKPTRPPAVTSGSVAPEIDVETTLQIHFESIILKVEENITLLNENRRLDFLKMRRFLSTAYNNLMDIDHSFENYELADLRHQLWDAYETYKDFKKKTAYIQNAYEQVFLSKQRRYKELHAKLDLNKAQIAKLKDGVTRFEQEIKEKTARLKKLNPQSEEAIYLSNEIKVLKRTLVDAIHEIGKLTEENHLFVEQLDNFYKTHYNQFKAVFTEFVANYESMLRKMMDVLAYRFDMMLWEKANRSKTIQKFFLEAGITDEFSSITYLKYYLKTLDANKLNEENQQLYDLLQYLETLNRHHILCIDEDVDFLTMVRQVIHDIDREIKVTLSSRPDTVLRELKSLQPDIFIINPEMRNLQLDNIIEFVRKKLQDVEIAFFAHKINRALLMTAKKHNVAAIIPKTHQYDELLEQFKQYIK